MASRKLWRIILFGAVLAVVAAVAAIVMARWPVSVSVARLERNVPIEVYGLGTVEARNLSEVGFEVGAALSEIHADHGDRVKKGTVLARLHSTEQEAKVAKAKAGISNAEAALQAAKAATDRAKAVLAQKQSVNTRKKALLGRNIISADEASEAEMEELVAQADVTSAQANVEVAAAHLEDAKSQYDYERVLLDHHDLIAPYDALVVKRHKELGAVLQPGEPLFTIIDPASVWALAYIDEGRAGGIQLGQKAVVKLRSMPRERFSAKVVRIGIESDRVSEERRVYVKCEECPQSFHLGEQVEVVITTGVLDEALLVPEHLVQGFDGAKGNVWIVEDGIVRRQEVSFGPRTLDGRIVVTSNLPPEGGKIVTRASGLLREGQRAKIVEETTS